MKVPDKVESLTILIRIDSQDKGEMEKIGHGLITKVNHMFWEQGYCVEDAFKVSSENGYKEEFTIVINPKEKNGDSLIYIIDEEKAKQHTFPQLESLTVAMIETIKQRQGLFYAFVRHSDIPGLDFLNNHIVKEDNHVYILKYDTKEINL